MSNWKNRICGYGEEAPDQLLANDRNWRVHSRAQQAAMKGSFEQVGIVQNVIVNRRSGKLVDGHMRAMIAISEEQASVPVTYVDLSDEEEALVLATLDPLSAMAVRDEDIFASLVAELPAVESADLAAMIAGESTVAKEGDSEQSRGVTCPECGAEFSP